MTTAEHHLRPFEPEDAARLSLAFAAHDLHKPVETFLRYVDEQQEGARACWIAEVDGSPAGYCTLVWNSRYEPFREAGIPEVNDLNVLPPYRRSGLGNALLDAAEALARTRSDVVGLGVGLYADYGAAQRIYVRRGYLPDGRGVMYHGSPVEPGAQIPIDDDATLRMTRTLPA